MKKIPPAQRKQERKTGQFNISQNEYVDPIVRDINKIFDSKDLPAEARIDLQECLRLLTKENDTPFEWDTTMYTHTYENHFQERIVPRLNLRDDTYDDVNEQKAVTDSLLVLNCYMICFNFIF